MKYEETLRRHVLLPLVQVGIPQDLIAARLGIDPSRLSRIINDKGDYKALTVDEIERLHTFVREGAAVFGRAMQLTAFPTPESNTPTAPHPPPAAKEPAPSELARRSKVK